LFFDRELLGMQRTAAVAAKLERQCHISQARLSVSDAYFFFTRADAVLFL
jgi:hypothetical protein